MKTMTRALRDYRNIWRVATVQRVPGAVGFMHGLAMLLFLGALMTAAVLLGRHGLADPATWVLLTRILLGLGGFWCALMWIMLVLPGTVLMHSVVNAMLLPRQRRRMLQMAAASWLLLTAAFTVAGDDWTLFPVVGIFLLVFGVMSAGNRHALGLVILVANWPWLSRHILPPALIDPLGGKVPLALLSVLLPPLGVWALRWMYPAGGDAHFGRRAGQVKQATRYGERFWTSANDDGPGLGFYAAALRRDCTRGPRHADPGRLLMHALGPSVHWSAGAGAVAVLLAIGIAMRLLLEWRGGTSLHDFAGGASIPMLGGVALAQLFGTAQFSQAMTRTAGEQALLRLAPLAGDKALLNRRLARQLIVAALRQWLVTLVAILAVSVLVGVVDALPRQFALCCLAGQASMMGLLGDYAGMGGWKPSMAWQAGMLAALEAAIAVGLGLATGISVWAWMTAIAVGMAVFQLRRLWQRMLAAPVAFPARRMG